jgi:hypothetical protein
MKMFAAYTVLSNSTTVGAPHLAPRTVARIVITTGCHHIDFAAPSGYNALTVRLVGVTGVTRNLIS